jgi:hypothetical protein
LNDVKKQNTTKKRAFWNLVADNKDQWRIAKSYTAPHMINDSNGRARLDTCLELSRLNTRDSRHYLELIEK